MTRIRGRLNRLERHAGPLGSCPVCRGNPPGGAAVYERQEDGTNVQKSGIRPCPGCGERGPTLVLIIDNRKFPLPKQ